MVPWALCLLCMYQESLTMLAKASGYHSLLFKGFRGVTQVYPLSTTVLNVLVDSFLHHWVMVAAYEEAGTDGFGQ